MSRVVSISALLVVACGATAQLPSHNERAPSSPMAAAGSSAANLGAPPPREDGRLPAGVRPVEYQLDLTNEGEGQRLLRAMLLLAMGQLGDDPGVLARARIVAAAWLSNPRKTDPDLARTALVLAARKGDRALFDRFVGVIGSPATPDERRLATKALTGFEDRDLVERALGLTLDGTVKAQDASGVVFPILDRRVTADAGYAWLEKNFDAIAKVLPRYVVGHLARVTVSLCEVERVRAAAAFLRPRLEKVEGTDKELQQAVENGLRCAAIAEKERASTEKWLATAKP